MRVDGAAVLPVALIGVYCPAASRLVLAGAVELPSCVDSVLLAPLGGGTKPAGGAAPGAARARKVLPSVPVSSA